MADDKVNGKKPKHLADIEQDWQSRLNSINGKRTSDHEKIRKETASLRDEVPYVLSSGSADDMSDLLDDIAAQQQKHIRVNNSKKLIK